MLPEVGSGVEYCQGVILRRALPRTCRTLRGASACTLPVSKLQACSNSGGSPWLEGAPGGRAGFVGNADPVPVLNEAGRSTLSRRNIAAQQQTKGTEREKHEAKSARIPVRRENVFQLSALPPSNKLTEIDLRATQACR